MLKRIRSYLASIIRDHAYAARTAIENGIELNTLNTKDFRFIPDLAFYMDCT